MIWHMARNEWQVLRREKVLWLATGVLAVTSAYALWNGAGWQAERWRDVRQIEQRAAQGLADLRQEAAEAGGEAPVGVARTDATLPPGALAFLAVGVADLHPHRAEISVWKRADDLFGRYQLDSPMTLLAGRFDLAFVVVYLLPLLVLALSYDLLSGDRERGVLGLTLAQGVGLGRLLLAKVLVRWLAVAGGLGAVGLGALAVAPAAAVPGLLAWLLVALAYGTFWLALAALVAAWGRPSETNAAALACLWLGWVLVVPGLLDLAARSASPVPSRLEFVTAMRQAASDAAKESAEILSHYYHEHPELAAAGRQGGFLPAYFASQRQVERRLSSVLGDHGGRLDGQRRLVARWRFLSPAVTAQHALLEVAGSDLGRQRRFAEQARTFLAQWQGRVSPKIFLGEGLSPADLDALPVFAFDEGRALAAGPLAIAFAGLLLPTLALGAAARACLRRFPIVG